MLLFRPSGPAVPLARCVASQVAGCGRDLKDEKVRDRAPQTGRGPSRTCCRHCVTRQRHRSPHAGVCMSCGCGGGVSARNRRELCPSATSVWHSPSGPLLAQIPPTRYTSLIGHTPSHAPPICACSQDYYRRYKVCLKHASSPVVMLRGLPQRFCQQCGTFHPISEFDADKRCASAAPTVRRWPPGHYLQSPAASQHDKQRLVGICHWHGLMKEQESTSAFAWFSASSPRLISTANSRVHCCS